MKKINLVIFSSLSLMIFSAHAEDHIISQKNKQFSQTEITIKKGDSITFKNDDSISHNVYSTSSQNAFDLKTQQPQKSSTIKFNEAGTTEVECALHSNMKLKVHVK